MKPSGAVPVVIKSLVFPASAALGRPFVVENRPGAGGTIGAHEVAKAAADGHTLLFTATPHVIGAWLYKKLAYDALGSFAPVALIASAGADHLVKLWNAADGNAWAAPHKQPIPEMKGDFRTQVRVAQLDRAVAAWTAKAADNKQAVAEIDTQDPAAVAAAAREQKRNIAIQTVDQRIALLEKFDIDDDAIAGYYGALATRLGGIDITVAELTFADALAKAADDAARAVRAASNGRAMLTVDNVFDHMVDDSYGPRAAMQLVWTLGALRESPVVNLPFSADDPIGQVAERALAGARDAIKKALQSEFAGRHQINVPSQFKLRFVGKTKSALADWARKLLDKKPFKLVAVALANKMARIAWTIMARGQSYDPAHAFTHAAMSA